MSSYTIAQLPADRFGYGMAYTNWFVSGSTKHAVMGTSSFRNLLYLASYLILCRLPSVPMYENVAVLFLNTEITDVSWLVSTGTTSDRGLFRYSHSIISERYSESAPRKVRKPSHP